MGEGGGHDYRNLNNKYSAGYKVHERHIFLTSLFGVTKPEEDESYAIMMKLVTWVPVSTILFSMAEAGMFYAYNFEVRIH